MKRITIHLLDFRSYISGTELQGWLMEQIPNDYAEQLHNQSVNPYSLYTARGKLVINALTDDFFEKIASILNLTIVKLTNHEAIKIERIEIETLTQKELAKIFYAESPVNQFEIIFNSPTSFKQNGEYVLFPTVGLIFQSVMRKYEALMDGESSIDEEMLHEIETHAKITSFNLRSKYFRVHGQPIPAFVGEIKITIFGANTLISYLRMLLTFGTFSGIGIKSSMGMGAILINERQKDE